MKERIFKQYPYRIELHAHITPASSCSHLKSEELVKLYHEKGYDGVVITIADGYRRNNSAIKAYDKSVYDPVFCTAEKTKFPSEKNPP